MWFSYHSGTIFEHFGRWNIRCYLGGVLGEFWRGFSEGFGRRKLDFGTSERSPVFKVEAKRARPSQNTFRIPPEFSEERTNAPPRLEKIEN